ncbi:MAG: hypothetical protein JWM80_5590 [Cyanobacteria bacterium RYN_339]|nr:hypothetical protein [Cyanobacteria bacterium RYN_339]
MEFRVEASLFSPNHGGGGGGGYHGRQGQSKREDEEAAAEGAEQAKGLTTDRCFLPVNRRSMLDLSVPLTLVTSEAPLDLEGIDDEIHRQLRVMTLMMIQLERATDRRTGLVFGDMVVGL